MLLERGRFAHGYALVSVCWLLALSACDRQKIAQLEEGVSTETQVRAQFGEPAAVFSEADGSRTFEYPRQPEGKTNYIITIGPDGKMSALRQVLTPANFAKVRPGLDKVEVRRLLGRPAATQRFDRKKEEVWDWRYAEGQQAKVFSVSFDFNGKVVSSASTDDMRAASPGG